MKPILEIRNLGKKYKIQHLAGGYLSLRERLASAFKFDRSTTEDFWALNNISFDVQPGESVGIIGRNGAGKSTLLKILSKITPPTTGHIISRGRVASLLEVGTGFHPELTGRENIFFNGSLLGMKHKEIERKFDEIVDFSGVEKFLDTSLKHFSSGMQLRLAFAVAAFLEPEILIIDEVLAVGDAEFQKKCLGKMEDVSRSGRTILFVSHNMDAVEALCKTAIFLSGGQKIDQGLSTEIVNKYMANPKKVKFKPVPLTKRSRLEHFSLSEESILSGAPLIFTLEIQRDSPAPSEMTDLCILFYNYKRQRVAIYDLRPHFDMFSLAENGTISFRGKINSFNLIDGSYSIGLHYGLDGERHDIEGLISLEVKQKIIGLKVKPYDQQYRGFVELN
ncbi:MAG TPA: ABC transporter ATP-binding protein [Cyclobacteriaceae bacterium]|nr:ABC transporter ATP-binding protein [Cyclobacteriaceae bacterium]